MSYLGIDAGEALRLAHSLRVCADRAESADELVREAEIGADLPTGCGSLLLDLAADLRVGAEQLTFAATTVASFRLGLGTFFGGRQSRPPVPERTPTPLPVPHPVTSPARADLMGADPARWNARPDMTWSDVQQVASHNSYRVPGGIEWLHANGVRTFELDVHQGPPLGLDTFAGWARRGVESGAGDWWVYHAAVSPTTEYTRLGDGLAAVAALDTRDPLTVFIDSKDHFDGGHGAELLDATLEHHFGDRLYSPAELMGRAGSASTPAEAVARIGWPTVSELEHRVMVVLTDKIDGYDGVAAFVARPPQFDTPAGVVRHVPAPGVVFYNAEARDLTADHLSALRATDSLVRTYFGPQCVDGNAEPNFRAIDIEPTDAGCPVGPAPSRGVPVPVTTD